MVPAAFDTLAAARRLEAAGIKSEHAEAIAEVMGLYFNQPRRATAERFDAQSAKLHAANARLGGGKGKSAARRDAFQSTTRSEFPAHPDGAHIDLLRFHASNESGRVRSAQH